MLVKWVRLRLKGTFSSYIKRHIYSKIVFVPNNSELWMVEEVSEGPIRQNKVKH